MSRVKHGVQTVRGATVRRSARLAVAAAIGVVVLGLAVLPGLRPVRAAGTDPIGAKAVAPEGFEYLIPQLEPGPYRLHGVVRDQNGRTAAGVKVVAFRGEAWQWGYKETFTDGEGRYEISGLPGGAYNISAVAHDGFDVAPVAFGIFFVPVEDVPHDFTLKPFDADPLEGTVVSETGEPVPGALVLSIREWSSYGIGLALQIKTDENGRFRIPRWTGPYGHGSQVLLPPTLGAFAEGHEPGVCLGELPENEPLTLVLDDGVRVSGTVRFKDSGKPAPGVTVLLRGTPADNDMPEITTLTDASGGFAFERLCPFQYQLVIYDPEVGYTSLEHPRLVLLDGKDVTGLDMQISHGATISGKVTYQETGDPIPGVRLWVPYVRYPTMLREAVTGPDGVYRIEHLPAGEYSISYEVPDGVLRESRPSDIGPIIAKTVTLSPDEQLADVDFAFERGAYVAGRVTDQAGRPIEGVGVRAGNLHDRGASGRRLTTSTVVTAADGAYRLWGLAASEEYRLHLSANGYVPAESEPFPVTWPVEAKDFVLQKGARVSGRVVDTQGRPVPTVAVTMKLAEGRAPHRLPDAWGGVDGHFATKEGAPPGTYKFELCTMNFGFGPYFRADAANPPLKIDGTEDIEGLELVLPDSEIPAAPAQVEIPEGAQLEIVSAQYGAQDKWVDVTELVKQRLRGNTLNITSSNDLAGDPIYGVTKELKVEYRIDGHTHTATGKEGETLRLP